MSTHFKSWLFALLFGLLGAHGLQGQALSDLQGKWSQKKNSDRWGDVTQTLEITEGRFAYRIQNKAGDTLLYAKGSLKVEKLGPFKCVKFTDIQGGYSEDSLEPVHDERTAIYTTGWNTITFAMNFDANREGEDPAADTYTKAK